MAEKNSRFNEKKVHNSKKLKEYKQDKHKDNYNQAYHNQIA